MLRRVIGNALTRMAGIIDPPPPAVEVPQPAPAPVEPIVHTPSEPVKQTPKLPSLLQPPFDAAKAAIFHDALAGEKPMAGFIDFVIAHLLTRDHRGIFWGDRMLTIDKAAGFLNDPAF